MHLIILISVILFWPWMLCAMTPNGSGTVLILYGVLPISIFVLALISTMIYIHRDEVEDQKSMRLFAWILSLMNLAGGFYWLYSIVIMCMSTIVGEAAFHTSDFIFLSLFTYGGFYPAFRLFKYDFRPKSFQ